MDWSNCLGTCGGIGQQSRDECFTSSIGEKQCNQIIQRCIISCTGYSYSNIVT